MTECVVILLPTGLLLPQRHLPPSILRFLLSVFCLFLSPRAALGMPRGDGSLAPQLCGCRTGAVTFKPGISTLSLPELSALFVRHKERKMEEKEGGVDMRAGRG